MIFLRSILLLLSLWPALAGAQELLFSSDSMLRLKMQGDLDVCIQDRGEERSYHPVEVIWYHNQDSTSIPMEIRVRGNFRRRKSTCLFPPLHIKMKKDTVVGTVFEGQKKLKLVTHCRGKNQAFEQKLFLEYLAYRSYNLLTEESFRVRLVEITYVHTGKDPYTEVHHGFLIEDDEDMAERIGGRLLEGGNIHPLQVDPVAGNRMALFEYMIGNTDWSIPAMHNVKLVLREPGTPPLVVPYDFDWSGLVDAPYAEPNPMLGIASVRERLYRGFCRPEESWEPVWEVFLAKKEEMLALYETSPYLTKAEKQQAMRYLREFYDIIETPGRRKFNIEERCRTNE